MSVQRFKSLLFKSAKLQQQIEHEQARRRPNFVRLLKLKKLRLLVANRLSAITRQHVPAREQRHMQPVMIRINNPRTHIYWKGR